MGTAALEVSGSDAARSAAELQAALAANAGPGDSVSPVEVQRSAEMVVAVIGLVFSGVDAAKTIWDWWQSRQPEGATVTIVLSDGTKLNLSNVTQGQVEIAFRQDESQQG